MNIKSICHKGWLVGLAVALIMSIVPVAPHAVQAVTTPTISIMTVEPGVSVKIQANNFPASQTFTVRMGAYGTLGVGGTVVATTESGPGGTFTAIYAIPAGLKTADKIAIRMDSDKGYYAYNWFYNTPLSATPTPGGAAPTAVPGYSGYPTFNISAVVEDDTVTIAASNFPAGQTFTIRMGKYGTLGVGGTVVATTDTGAGGSFTAKYVIPAALKGQERIAIRMDSSKGYYAYNWFWNNTKSAVEPATPKPERPAATPIAPKYTGYPYFYINTVVKDSKVTIAAHNFPAGLTFTVRMGAYGTMGVGGTKVTSIDTGKGGDFTATYDIPSGLKGLDRIAIRLESGAGYYAYNWFWNNTTP